MSHQIGTDFKSVLPQRMNFGRALASKCRAIARRIVSSLHRPIASSPLLVFVALAATASAGDSASERGHWAFLPVVRPEVPGSGDERIKSAIDAFVFSRLADEGIAPAEATDPRTLLRRVYLDLIGLPPTPAEQAAFMADPSPEAFELVVEDLIGRPQYGERWARHWLDVVRYAESNGYERDGAKPHAWRYRDYVIDSLNRDKPFDRFVVEQLAGDELPNADAETRIATTFLRLGSWDDEPAEPMLDRYEQLDDVLGTTATVFLGITLRCARCHDHKFEPFSQDDYYRVLSVFEPLKRPQDDREDLDRIVGTKAELECHEHSVVDAEKLAADLRRLTEAAPSPLKERLAAQADAVAAAYPPDPPRAYIWYEDTPTPPVTHVLARGNPESPLREVSTALPTVLVDEQPGPPAALENSSGRRLWFARWLASPQNPLTARVIVNRVWQHHFGEGLVATESDFGEMGDAPSHPELLDWLAADFMANGWRLKRLHKQIVLSRTWQLGSADDASAAAADPDGRLLWRWRTRKLEAEAVRDSILAASGTLNGAMHGPSIYPVLPQPVLDGQSRPGDGWGESTEHESARRSVYIFVKRSLAVPELEVLDSPDTTSSCEQRVVSTTGPQALTWLNGRFVHEQSRHFATRLIREAGPNRRAQIHLAFELALCRPPSAEESRWALSFLAAQEVQIVADATSTGETTADAAERALASLVLVLFNTNEFTYVD